MISDLLFVGYLFGSHLTMTCIYNYTCFIWIKRLPDGVFDEAKDLRVIQTDVDRRKVTLAALADLAMNQSGLEVLAGFWKSGNLIQIVFTIKSAISTLFALLLLCSLWPLSIRLKSKLPKYNNYYLVFAQLLGLGPFYN